MSFRPPVAQAVGDHLDHPRMSEVEGISGAGIVDVIARLVRQEPVVRNVVDAFEGKRRTALVALGGVVVDDVEDDLEISGMEGRNHLLEFAQGLLGLVRIPAVRREKSDAVVPQ